jgi:hypothetical protein
MPRLRTATPTNRTAGADVGRVTLRQVRSRCNAAGLALKLARGADAAQALEKLSEVHQAHADLDELMYELAGAAILSGRSVESVAAATGISTATLTRRVPRTMTALRGQHLVRDPQAPHGWSAA